MISLKTFGTTAVVLIATAFSYTLFLFVRNLLSAQKSFKNKTQLRSLLEAFDLEVPDELKEFDANVINHIRAN